MMLNLLFNRKLNDEVEVQELPKNVKVECSTCPEPAEYAVNKQPMCDVCVVESSR